VAKIIVVTSGKGGVGKTTTSASFAVGLATRGYKTAVIDFDIGLRNLDLIMGCERRVVYDFVNVIRGEANLNQALIRDKHAKELFILPASQTRDKDALTLEGVGNVLILLFVIHLLVLNAARNWLCILLTAQWLSPILKYRQCVTLIVC
jgi:septum site-determining protein MinD